MAVETMNLPERISSRSAWSLVVGLTILLAAATVSDSLRRYQRFETGWAWDLAYYNQWYWAVTQGDQTLTVRPTSAYADEGPSVWKTNYVSPLRFALIPIYALWPDPRTLLVVHAFGFWLVIPAAYMLVRSEGNSRLTALMVTAVVPFTPLLWPLAQNDFREIQLAIPFMIWGVQGVRSRKIKIATVGVAEMLACRQEMAVVVASLAFLRANAVEDIGTRFRWRLSLLLTGGVWLFLVFFGHLRFWAGSTAPNLYLQQFGGAGAPLDQSILTALESLAIGLGAWVLFLPFAPREAVLIIPWLWSLAHGKWALRMLSTEDWHHVRYASPIVGLGFAAGLIGLSRLVTWLNERRRWKTLFAVVLGSILISFLGLRDLQSLMRRQPDLLSRRDRQAAWKAIEEVDPEAGVLSAYETSAPLSSRRRLYSYRLPLNQPKGYPTLPAEVSWIFFLNRDGSTEAYESQGFCVVYAGDKLTIYSRPAP